MHSVCCPVEATESAGTMARQAYQREQHTDGPQSAAVLQLLLLDDSLRGGWEDVVDN